MCLDVLVQDALPHFLLLLTMLKDFKPLSHNIPVQMPTTHYLDYKAEEVRGFLFMISGISCRKLVNVQPMEKRKLPLSRFTFDFRNLKKINKK